MGLVHKKRSGDREGLTGALRQVTVTTGLQQWRLMIEREVNMSTQKVTVGFFAGRLKPA